ncbi:SDR family NAD(P)-dependent oxidoreductase [Candidatus Allofournierella excrementigallinarum]|uniref:SDR family NAD(P)-dependent oxidoreductase n=1 Tax=Candidatus Allofournierella excrementigallinarum TaxID=2838592 RepID=UPI00374E646D
MKRLENKVAIITGAAMGQGAAEAYLFAREGAKVVAADMAEDALKETVDAINADFPGMALGVHLDVASEENWQQVVKQAVETFGTVDILVNNAGVGSRGVNYDKTDREAFDRIMGINAWGSFAGIKTVVPVMKKAGGGSIVNVSSLAAVVGVEFNAYTLTKGAVVSMTRAAAVDLGKDNIRVNTIIPGTIVTPMTKIICDYPKVLKSCEEKTCLGHIGEPNDIAYGVLYLASDEAKYVTGSDLTIDGGERFKDALELEL